MPPSPASPVRSARCPRNVTGSRAARARLSSRARSGPSPATTNAASTPRPRSSTSASRARPGRFSVDSREHISSSTAARPAYRPRRPALRRPGCRAARSTPRGARTTFRAPARRNSAAAHSVVHTTRL
ncbi:hypothetical protein ACFXO2_22480 [Streptomyces sp. NPDC059152]|uniref:hypothetical protein n=1 Tax=Streptomyces sp. NPDC059152 TaxID=3346742 RepID=UPI0036B8D939